MPTSSVRMFSDPNDYAAAIRAGAVDLTVSGRGTFSAKLTRIDLHRLWMQRFSENLPRVADVTNLVSERAYFMFLPGPGPSLSQDGVQVPSSGVLRCGEGQAFYQGSPGSARQATMSLPVEDVASLGEAVAGADLIPPHEATLVTPPPAALLRLRRLHAAAGQLAEEAPEIIANPDAARGLEQTLIETLAGCLGRRDRDATGLAQGQHAIVMRRFRRVLEENPEQPIYIPEICRAIRVSERSLRICCQEHLGMSPKHYLTLRRMNLARRALRAAADADTTVTDVATRFGFWQLGRFAVEYRALFGETPSATLRRRAD